MKHVKSLIIIIGLFIITLISILLVFTNNFKNARLKNTTKELLEYVNSIDSGEFYYKAGILYDSSSNILNTEHYIDGEGQIIKDKYNNIKLLIQLKDRCIIKTPLGKTEIHSKCKNEYNLKPEINKNNSQITFNFNNKVDAYLISKNDDFKGKWIKLNSNKLVLNLFEEGKYYIWFKDDNGNISDAIEYEIECLQSDNLKYDENLLYCPGSIVLIDDIKWIVIEDKDREVSLMSLKPLEEKLNHTNGEIEYKWSASNINKYLNETYINSLPEKIKNNLLETQICDVESGKNGCDSDDGCGGYRKEIVNKYKWNCEEYSSSKIRIISYDEYSKLYDILEDKSIIAGYYWTINSYKKSKTGISILNNGEVFVGENISNKLDIYPVISMNR